LPCSSGISPLPATRPTGHAMTGCRPPPGVSLASSWSRVDHNGFGSHKSDLGIFIPRASLLARSRFRSAFRLATPMHSLALASRRMIRHCSTPLAPPSQDSLRGASFLSRLTFVSPPSFRSFQSHACGFFSAFAHATCTLSVYSQYLGLGFNAPIFVLHT